MTGGAAIAIYALPTVWCFYASNHLSESVHLNYTMHGRPVAPAGSEACAGLLPSGDLEVGMCFVACGIRPRGAW